MVALTGSADSFGSLVGLLLGREVVLDDLALLHLWNVWARRLGDGFSLGRLHSRNGLIRCLNDLFLYYFYLLQ